MARREDAPRDDEARKLGERLLGPGRSVVEAPGEEVGDCRSGLDPDHLRVERAQPHRPSEAWNRIAGLTAEDSLEAAEVPGHGEVGVEHESSIDRRDGALEVVTKMGKRVAASGEGNWIGLAQLHCPTSEPSGLGGLL